MLAPNTELVIGVDNSTAKWALEKGFYGADDRLCDDIQELLARCHELGSRIKVVQVPGSVQAADELSRNRPHCPKKIAACYDLMRHAADKFQWLRDMKQKQTKRQRAETTLS
jgi:hypothetical protein